MPQTASAQRTATLGVGFIGCGPVTQAIHLPSLARLTDIFTVTHVVDINEQVAATVGSRVGAHHSTSVDALLEDPSVDVVAICSPNTFHASQVVAACKAGKKAVLCEKPFAVSASEAAEISAVSLETGVPIVVGAMHTFDPGWLAAEGMWGDLPETAHTIRSNIVIPPNSRFEDFATEVIARPNAGPPDFSDPAVVAAMLEGGILGLAIHNLPLVRRFLPRFDDLQILSASAVPVFGYEVLMRVGGKTVELTASVNSTWKPDWRFEVIGHDARLTVQFTPSYVQAGSAVATFTSGGHVLQAGPFSHNGYEGEWRLIADIVAGKAQAPAAGSLIDDLRLALAIAEGARAHVLEAAK